MAMLSLTATIPCLAALVTAGVATAAQPPKTLVKDVAIIGGGASGAYAAVRLRDDYGKSIALVEMQGRLVS
jgi:heterodisulfide reductase subunit A-like polyferredoxin